jgi:type 1 glutamine amidotransferase
LTERAWGRPWPSAHARTVCLGPVIAAILSVAWPSAAVTDQPLAATRTDAAHNTRLTSFKGNWPGPGSTAAAIPGPGPAPGQSIADYFAHMKSGPRSPRRCNVLVLGGSRGFHHDSIPAAMDLIYQLGKANGQWDTEMSTDFELVIDAGGEPMNAGFQPKGLRDFDAVVVASASGDWALRADQKAALLKFVHSDGKGLVVMHAGLDANHGWRDYLDMIGAEMAGHPFNTIERVVVNFPLINEDARFPAVAHLPGAFHKQDELYVVRNWSREDVDVVLRIDNRKLDFKGVEDQVPPDHDLPVAWAKVYGRGRVFASSLGHTRESFTDPDVQRMYQEAVKWVLGLTDADISPHPRRD